MFRFVVLAALFVGMYQAQDFDTRRCGYEFIYHHSMNLLLTIDDDNCYFTSMSSSNDETEKRVMDAVEDLWRHHGYRRRSHGEDGCDGHHARSSHSGKLVAQKTTLDEMRDLYQDLLADFHCTDKQVWNLVQKSH